MRAISVVGILVLGFSACQLDTTPDDGGDTQDDLVDGADLGDDTTDTTDAQDATDDAPCQEDDPPVVQLRNPETLECNEFSTSTCTPGVPIPSWGTCTSECTGLREEQCADKSACRVVKDAACLVQRDCITDYLGCFPTDMATSEEIDCWTADAFECSRSPDCSAAHSAEGSGDTRPFELCIVEGKSPGFCYLPVACDRAAPDCPQGTTPGVEGACYTGACIPEDLCQIF